MNTLTEEQLSSSGTTAAGKDSKKSPASSGRRLDTSDLQEGRGGRRYVNGTFPREQDRDSKFSSSAPSSRIRVLIAANSKTEARSLSAMLSDRNEFMVVGTATTFNELDATLHLRTDVDVLVTDVELGGATVFPIVEKAVTLRPNLNVLCYTNRSEPNFIMNAIRAGALGYVLRNSQESLDNCVRLINGGGSPMSPAVTRHVLRAMQMKKNSEPLVAATNDAPDISTREREILELLAKGIPFAEIGTILMISPHTEDLPQASGPLPRRSGLRGQSPQPDQRQLTTGSIRKEAGVPNARRPPFVSVREKAASGPFSRPAARLTAVLLEKAYVGHHHASVDGLAHVVDREQADLHGRERLHLDARLAVAFAAGRARHGVRLLVKLEVDRHAGESDRMAERHEIRRALAGHDGRHARNADHVALLGRTTRDELERGGLHVDAAAGHCDSVRLGLLADVDHMGLTGLVKVCQFAHFRYL